MKMLGEHKIETTINVGFEESILKAIVDYYENYTMDTVSMGGGCRAYAFSYGDGDNLHCLVTNLAGTDTPKNHEPYFLGIWGNSEHEGEPLAQVEVTLPQPYYTEDAKTKVLAMLKSMREVEEIWTAGNEHSNFEGLDNYPFDKDFNSVIHDTMDFFSDVLTNG